jgi:hypothetical protein
MSSDKFGNNERPSRLMFLPSGRRLFFPLKSRPHGYKDGTCIAGRVGVAVILVTRIMKVIDSNFCRHIRNPD